MHPYAERALRHAKGDLRETGTPAYVPVAVEDDGTCTTGALVVASQRAAVGAARTLALALPEARIVIVSRDRAATFERFTVLSQHGDQRLLVRDEVPEALAP